MVQHVEPTFALADQHQHMFQHLAWGIQHYFAAGEPGRRTVSQDLMDEESAERTCETDRSDVQQIVRHVRETVERGGAARLLAPSEPWDRRATTLEDEGAWPDHVPAVPRADSRGCWKRRPPAPVSVTTHCEIDVARTLHTARHS